MRNGRCISMITVMLSLAACQPRTAPSPAPEPRQVAGVIIQSVHTGETTGTLTPADAQALGTRLSRLQLVPDSVTLRVGDTLDLMRIAVSATDSAGYVLGRLPIFDFGPMSGSAAAVGGFMRVVARAPGVSRLRVALPAPYWTDSSRPRPEAYLRIGVVD